jgi:CheY-like chemotaxis protein
MRHNQRSSQQIDTLEVVKGETMAQGKILIIDDDPDITEAMTVVLENRGYEVPQRPGLRHGAVEEGQAGLIILDVMMRTSQEGFEFSPGKGNLSTEHSHPHADGRQAKTARFRPRPAMSLAAREEFSTSRSSLTCF